METENSAPEGGVKGFVMKKIGPLPLAAWVVIGAGIGLTIVYLRKGKSAVSATPTSTTSTPTPAGGFNGQSQGDPFSTQNLADSISNLNGMLSSGVRSGTVPGVSSGASISSPNSIIDDLYRTLLGRERSAGESSNWNGVLATQGYDALWNGIANSPEARSYAVHNDYKKYLGRPGGSAEANAWSNSAESLGGIANDIQYSPEGVGYANAHPAVPTAAPITAVKTPAPYAGY